MNKETARVILTPTEMGHTTTRFNPVLPGPDYELTPEEIERIEEIARAMYTDCYMGHIPLDQWLKFAAFTYFYQLRCVPVG